MPIFEHSIARRKTQASFAHRKTRMEFSVHRWPGRGMLVFARQVEWQLADVCSSSLSSQCPGYLSSTCPKYHSEIVVGVEDRRWWEWLSHVRGKSFGHPWMCSATNAMKIGRPDHWRSEIMLDAVRQLVFRGRLQLLQLTYVEKAFTPARGAYYSPTARYFLRKDIVGAASVKRCSNKQIYLFTVSSTFRPFATNQSKNAIWSSGLMKWRISFTSVIDKGWWTLGISHEWITVDYRYAIVV